MDTAPVSKMSSRQSTLQLPCDPKDLDLFISEPSELVLKTLRQLRGDVLVLGAGGKMGLHMCMMLRRGFDRLGLPNKVTAVSRFSTLHDREAFEKCGIETIAGDLCDEGFLASLPDAPEVVFMAGAKFGTAGNSGILRQMNVELPAKVGRRFSKSRIACFSTGCVYEFTSPATGGSTEESPTSPIGDYAQSCLQREAAFTRVSLEEGTEVILLRLNYSNEPRYGVLVDICTKVLNEEPVDVSMGYVNVIWQGDAVQHLIAAIPLASAPPRPLNITGAEILHVRDLAERFGAMLGKKVTIAGKEEETAWLNNPAKAHRLFGSPPTSLDQMMQWIAAWLTTCGETYGKPTGFERRDGKF